MWKMSISSKQPVQTEFKTYIFSNTFAAWLTIMVYNYTWMLRAHETVSCVDSLCHLFKVHRMCNLRLAPICFNWAHEYFVTSRKEKSSSVISKLDVHKADKIILTQSTKHAKWKTKKTAITFIYWERFVLQLNRNCIWYVSTRVLLFWLSIAKNEFTP